MQDRYIPVERDGTARDPQSSAQFMMRCLLASRLEVGLPSDEDGSEQDVNVYLAQLLCSYMDPGYCLRVGQYIAPHDSTVFERVQTSPSARFKYAVYKANADHLLVWIGVFQNPEGRREPRLAAFRTPAGTYLGRGKTYYDFASTYSQRVFGSASAVHDVLGKLAAGFERYVCLLAHLRGEYFDLVDRLSDGEMFHLQRAATAEGLEALRNAFLDRYSEFRRDPSPAVRQRLEDVVARLRHVDPDFHCDILN